YLKILPVINMLDKVPVIALTATATSRVLQDITTHLAIADAIVIQRSLIRTNLSLNVINTEDTYRFLKQLLSGNKLPAILYANSRKKVQEVSLFLNGQQISSSFYHGGLQKTEKQQAYESWMSEQTLIMVATTAFGMGIDKDNVNIIVHIDLPLSLENYIQEIGRAGRNGAAAASYLVNSDFARHSLEKRLQNDLFDREMVKAVYRDLNRYYSIAHGEIPETVLEFDLQDFCRQYSLKLSNTYAILKFLENEGVLVFDENPHKQSAVKCTASPDAVLRYIGVNKAEPLQAILRSYGGVFDQAISINEALLAQKLAMSRAGLKAEITKYAADGILEYHNKESATGLKFLLPREDKSLINRIAGNIAQYNKVKTEKVEAVMRFIGNREVCRNKLLADYFGEKPGADCGNCDVCRDKNLKKKVPDVPSLQAEIIRLIAAHGQLSSKELEPLVPVSAEELTTALQLLLDTGKISLNSHFKFERKPS
ncbi:MAG: RecQ family zinc-binding domain-containing protein, partial [Flavobacteriaceae bacterium]|nr:RecQ family zinc-binding domain-containing protein [Flavobacteriaceae bacterium]